MNPLDPLDSSFLLASTGAVRAGQSGKTDRGKDTKKSGKIQSAFSDILSETREAEQAEELSSALDLPKEEALRQLLDEVYSMGDALKGNPMPDAIINYKKAVKSFLYFVVNNSYDVHEQKSGRNILKRKKFVQLEVIDQKLERLAAEVISAQKDQLKILARIEEINGMLVNLVR
ncbi:MAG: YaaR family protein [Spirochaetaceae bacterium]|jgi:uncharacterized protein YaaR (DUF327 family)|nr:YaaR family protein [Spirochaetaceae bacterium]